MSASLTIPIPVWLDFIFTLPLLAWRRLRYGFAFRLIYLGLGFYTKVGPADYYRLLKYKWFVHGNGSNLYAARNDLTKDLRNKIVYMHRQIANPPANRVVDHHNCDSLDNHPTNLRVVTHAQNMRNRRKRKGCSSKYIGVYYNKNRKCWVAEIRCRGKKRWLGQFHDELSAAKAYDIAAKRYYGDLIRLNFPE